MVQVNSDDMQVQLMTIFSEEAAEHVQAMNQHLLTLEDGSADEARERLIAELFREAHSLKGAARAVGLIEVEARSGELEDLFARMKEGTLEPASGVLEGAYETLDAIGISLGAGAKAEIGGAPAGEPLPGGDLDASAQPPASKWRATPEESVRIATDKLDALMAGVGELVGGRIAAERRVVDVRALESALDDWDSALSKPRGHALRRVRDQGAVTLAQETMARLQAARGGLAQLRRLLEADARRAVQLTTNLQDDVRQTRMFPVSRALESFPRMVRDLARDCGKEITLSIAGADTEADRSVLEQIKDPLMHLLRNSVDHGIETPEVRIQAGKPAGRIVLSVQHRGDMLIIDVTDDGAGIDVQAVRRGAVDKGLLTSAAAAELTDRQAISLIFRSGLSTSPIVTDLSGRGVGLDVVRESVELAHGSVQVESQLGAGTTFSLSLPLSVSTMHCLLIELAGQIFALPVGAVKRVMRTGPEAIGRAGGRETVQVDGRPVVLTRLADVLGLDGAPAVPDPGSKLSLIVLGGRDHQIAFLVDSLMQTHEVVIKRLPDPLLRVRHVAGATILGSGQVAMLLSSADLMASVEATGGAPGPVATRGAVPASILVVEDSITTRTLEKSILEAAGYRVRVAGDGAEGLRLVQAEGCDLVVTDIEMPIMDGFELTARLRADPRYRGLPIVVVSSRDAREDRERGIQAGADAYIAKGALDREGLLDTIRRLI